MPSSLATVPTLQKLLDYIQGLGADDRTMEHVRQHWDIEVKPRKQGGADIYWLCPGHPGRHSSMIKAAEHLGLQPKKRAVSRAHYTTVVGDSDSDGEGYKPPGRARSEAAYDDPFSDRPRPKRQIRPPQRTQMDLPLRGRSLPSPSPSPPPPSFYNAPAYGGHYTAPAAATGMDAFGSPHFAQPPSHNYFDPYFNQPAPMEEDPQLSYPPTALYEPALQHPVSPLPVKHEAPPKIHPPVLLELEPAEPAAVLGTHTVPSSTAASTSTASVPQAGTAVEWVASFILHANGSHVQLLDRSGLVLACQHALPLRYVVEEGSGPNRVCLRILPLLDEEPEERWASLDVATAADQLGTVFDGGPRFTGAAVTALLNEQHRQQLCMGDGEDEWALLDLRLPQMSSRVVSTNPQGVLRMEESQLLPAYLSSPQQPVHLQLQPRQQGTEAGGPGMELVLKSAEEVLQAGREQTQRAQEQQQRLLQQQQLQEQQQEQHMMEELHRQRQQLERLQQQLQQTVDRQGMQVHEPKQQQQTGGDGEQKQGVQPHLQGFEQQGRFGRVTAVVSEKQLQLQGLQDQTPIQARAEHSMRSPSPVTRKSCTCKKSRCLKLYCDCFAIGAHCCDNCSCLECMNNAYHAAARQEAVNVVLSRDPHAFQSKIESEQAAAEHDPSVENPVSKHRKGCSCKRSACLKKYCECFTAGVFCSDTCKCVECKNFEVPRSRTPAATAVTAGLPSQAPDAAATFSLNIHAPADAAAVNELPPVAPRQEEIAIIFDDAAQQQAMLQMMMPGAVVLS